MHSLLVVLIKAGVTSVLDKVTSSALHGVPSSALNGGCVEEAGLS